MAKQTVNRSACKMQQLSPITCLALCILETPQGTSTNSEDPDEMPQNARNATFYQGIHCFVKAKKSSDKKIHFFEKL